MIRSTFPFLFLFWLKISVRPILERDRRENRGWIALPLAGWVDLENGFFLSAFCLWTARLASIVKAEISLPEMILPPP